MGNRAKDLNKPSLLENQEKTVKVYFGIFFDGTNNHMGQATIGEIYRKKKDDLGLNNKEIGKELKKILDKELKEEAKQIGYTGSSVQGNDRSNVALLYPYFNQKSEKYVCTPLYMEGIGTTKDGDTALRGQAFGTGATGIEAKVEEAIESIPEQINKFNFNPGDNIELYFELFGFSRGAAAARNFVYKILKNESTLKAQVRPRNLTSIKINYVGLFDTVSSHGIKHSNDVKNLNLDAIKNANNVFHICAADEFRDNFALTNISSAGGKGKEIFIPGAHSDIGGGYAAGEYSVTLGMDLFPNKTVNDVNTVVTKDSLMRLGWIRDTPKNYNIIDSYSHSQRSFQPSMIQFKNTIKKGYSYISLELMAENANSKRAKMLNSTEEKTPSQLKEIKDMADGSTSLEKCQSLFNSHYKDIKLREEWLHFSSNDGKIGMGPRKKNGILKRKEFNG